MTAEFSDAEIERYARQIIMPEIGGSGQQALKRAHVAIVGAGGLGSPAALYLAGAGVGTLTLVDDDTVSLSNLHRQIVHTGERVGVPKVASAQATLAALNNGITIHARPERLDDANIETVLVGVTHAIDGSDNTETRHTVADWCAREQVPFVTGSLYRFDGNITVVAPWLGRDGTNGVSPAYRDVFPDVKTDAAVPDCAQAGILGPVAGVIGTIQAVEAIKLITGVGVPLIGRLLHYDALNARFTTFATGPDP